MRSACVGTLEPLRRVMDSGLTLAVEAGVARLRFTRPESRNSLTRSVCRELHAALTAVDQDASCRFLVLEGSGGAFASGADITELEALRSDRAELRAFYRELRAVHELSYDMNRITIAVIDGFCMGAGLSLALACDLRLATPRSVFAAPPAKLGLIYSDAEVWRLSLRVGTASARDLLFTGRRVAAEEALRLGLIQRLSAAPDPEALLIELLSELQSCSPNSLRKTKAQILRLERDGVKGLRGDEEAEDALLEPDAAEGMRAFLERRKPRFL
jgi:enoyl-CoA hydratase/carnithine racemase